MNVFPMANKTRSGTHIWRWVDHLVNIFKVKVKQNFPAFYDEDFQLYAMVLESVIYPILRIMQIDKHNKDDIAMELQVNYWIGISRYLSRGVLNESMDQGLGESVIKMIHIWESYEKNRDKKPGFYDMMQNYSAGRDT